jgi:hypothetical protein
MTEPLATALMDCAARHKVTRKREPSYTRNLLARFGGLPEPEADAALTTNSPETILSLLTYATGDGTTHYELRQQAARFTWIGTTYDERGTRM